MPLGSGYLQPDVGVSNYVAYVAKGLAKREAESGGDGDDC